MQTVSGKLASTSHPPDVIHVMNAHRPYHKTYHKQVVETEGGTVPQPAAVPSS